MDANPTEGAMEDSATDTSTPNAAVTEPAGPEQHASHDQPNYMAVWGGLAVLTLVEVGVAFLGFTKVVTVIILIGLAIWKAALVAMYYMHLRFEPPRLVVMVLAPLPLAVILVLAALTDF